MGLGTDHRLSLAQNPVLLAGQIAILLASCNRDVARLRKRRQVAALVGLEVAQRPHSVHYTIISRNPTTRTPPLLTPKASRLGVQSPALCHRKGAGSRKAARNSQHGGCGNILHLDHPNSVRGPKVARKSIRNARRRSRGGLAGETEAEKLRAGRQATSKALSSADKAAFGISPGGDHMRLKLAAFILDPLDPITLMLQSN